jgi:glycosyltransferase involved in cell wall biosynthesis
MMRDAPALGIGVPVRNGEKVLGPTLESLRRQEFTGFEVVVSDNASTDGTERIVRSFAAADPRFRYVRQETNIGILPNFNAAFALTRGEFFMWAANDIYHPRFLDRCLSLLRAHPDAVAAFTQAALIDQDGNPRGQVREDINWSHPDPIVRFGEFASFRHKSLAVYAVMRRSAVARTQLKLPFWGSDRLFLAELALQGPLLLDDEQLFFNRSHDDFKADHRRPPVSYLVGMTLPRALTVYYGRQLARSLAMSGVDRTARRRVMARWAWENRELLARSTLRGGVETAKQLWRSPRARQASRRTAGRS